MGDRRLSHKGLTICLAFLCFLFTFAASAQAVAAEEDPYQYSPLASLIGGCGTSKIDPVEDPGCPGGAHPPKVFSKPLAVAVDQFGNHYVASYGFGDPEGSEGRIDVFDSDGLFITQIVESGPLSLAVDSDGVLYATVHASGSEFEFIRYVPTEYKPAEGKIKYGTRTVLSDAQFVAKYGVAVDLSNDHVFLHRGNAIDEFGSLAEGNKLLDTITTPKLFAGYFLAVDSQRRRLYASSCPGGDVTQCWVLVFDADTNALVEEVTGGNTPEKEFQSQKGWISIAVDETDGDFFVGDLELTDRVYKFNAAYEYLSTLEFDFVGGNPLQIAVSNAPEPITNHRYLYVPSHPGGVGHAFAFEPPGVEAPEIKSVGVDGIGETEAQLQGVVEPNGGDTTYTFEYITQQAFEEAGNSFSGATVAREGTISGSRQEAKVTAPVVGLSPGTAYRFRLFVENEIDSDEAEVAFATYDDAPPVSGTCPNEALRTAFSASLPDCRAYELVTPPDTNGRSPKGVGFIGDRFPTVEANPLGNAVSFLTEGGSLPGSGGSGAFNGDLYRSERGASGWVTVPAGPNGAESAAPDIGSTSPDQGYAFWVARVSGSAVIEGGETHYVRYPDGHSELVGRGSEGADPRAIGKLITENGAHIVFQTPEVGSEPIHLEPNAPPSGTAAVYDRIKNPAAPGGEETKVVSLLPGDETPTGDAKYVGASADGEGIAFSVGGTLYLRVHSEETFKIGAGLTFAGVAEGGKRIFYVEAGDLNAFDATVEAEIDFSEVGNAVPVNVAPGGTRAYFVSTTEIPGSGENPKGALAVAGLQNLYLSEEGAISFVATVTKRDVEGENASSGPVDGLGLWTFALLAGELPRDPSRLNPEGSVLLFQSRANLSGYDPEGLPQVYRYDSADHRLHCLSCIPTKGKASGGASLQSFIQAGDTSPPFSPFGFVPGLRADGNRAFFESTEALVSRDSNGVRDVYEWEEQGVGSCARPGGCVYLITSGRSEGDNYLYGHSASGDDVFFTTADALSGFDAGDTLSIYDARVGGGFPEPVESICEGEGCRPVLTPAPPLPGPESGVRSQSGNPVRSCPKGKRKIKRGGKVVCVKKKSQRKKKGKRKAGKTAGKGARK